MTSTNKIVANALARNGWNKSATGYEFVDGPEEKKIISVMKNFDIRTQAAHSMAPGRKDTLVWSITTPESMVGAAMKKIGSLGITDVDMPKLDQAGNCKITFYTNVGPEPGDNQESKVEKAIKTKLCKAFEKVSITIKSTYQIVHGPTAKTARDLIPNELKSFYDDITDQKFVQQVDSLVARLR